MEFPVNITRHVTPLSARNISSGKDVFVQARLFAGEIIHGNILAIGGAVIAPKTREIRGETSYEQTSVWVGRGGWFLAPACRFVVGNIEVYPDAQLDLPELWVVVGKVHIHPGGKANLGRLGQWQYPAKNQKLLTASSLPELLV